VLLTKELKETNDKIVAKANDSDKAQLEKLVANKKKIMAAMTKNSVKLKKLKAQLMKVVAKSIGKEDTTLGGLFGGNTDVVKSLSN